jgi:3-dehydroquinate synthetase
MALDKKRDAAGLRMVLLQDFGAPTVVRVDAATVDAALAAVGVV